MKKKVVAALGAMAIAGVIGLGFAQSGIVNAGPNLSENDVRNQVNDQYPGAIKELELDENGKDPVYEVEIEIDGREYELAIDGNSGEVLKLNERAVASDNADEKVNNKEKEDQKSNEVSMKSKDDDTDNKDDSNETHQGDTSNQPAENESDNAAKTTEPKKEEKRGTNNAAIGESKAKSIALEQYDGTVKEIDLDEDDGRLIYEIEMQGKNGEAEIEIDAYTGAVIIIDVETYDEDDDDNE
ncbi:PepSY domain-containing protein [Oceanobacillus piezotolerans]|nr:PepSY domain-containing protein [Oceanobacillus piezotolerans]